ncbi:N-acetylglucosamine-6-phosphate deacetylase [Actinotalea fermentans]|uniref:N-acetylglucosamine-6-phosphate deacetylase n=1 Tax=Actinotalea fermentans TaxID=43671 RepID=A0A511Z1I2_9CELL|nr:N-acetylglucosamine-6-phosphate deacetylase [Actinotalea fermentans]
MSGGVSGVVLRGRVVTPDQVLDDGVVVTDGARITWVGPAAQAPDGVALPEPAPQPRTYLPGLVDLHCHGGGGAGFPDSPDVATAHVAATEHLRHGTTSLVASLVTADLATLLARTATLAELADTGELAGIHLEGPFLAPARCGAQDPAFMTDGRPDAVRQVAEAARGWLATMTVAPDVPGVLGPDGVAATLGSAGALPSFGHTDATEAVMAGALAQARAQLRAAPAARSGRPTVTHLFNGMAPWHHRAPGPVPAALAAAARGDAVVELVADGVHLAPGTIRAVFALVGAANVALVTDAMAATGMPDGRYVLGPADVVVRGGVARLATAPGEPFEAGAIAGGTAHLLDVLRTTVTAGVDLRDAVTAATATPAAVLGRSDIGALAPGLRADVLEVDGDMRPLRVMRAGEWLYQ